MYEIYEAPDLRSRLSPSCCLAWRGRANTNRKTRHVPLSGQQRELLRRSSEGSNSDQCLFSDRARRPSLNAHAGLRGLLFVQGFCASRFSPRRPEQPTLSLGNHQVHKSLAVVEPSSLRLAFSRADRPAKNKHSSLAHSGVRLNAAKSGKSGHHEPDRLCEIALSCACAGRGSHAWLREAKRNGATSFASPATLPERGVV